VYLGPATTERGHSSPHVRTEGKKIQDRDPSSIAGKSGNS